MAKKPSMRSRIVPKKRTAGELGRAMEAEDKALARYLAAKKREALARKDSEREWLDYMAARAERAHQQTQLIEHGASQTEPEADEKDGEIPTQNALDSITQSDAPITARIKQGQGPKP
jgi:hypothetical protein